MIKFIPTILLICLSLLSFAQSSQNDSANAAHIKDSLRMAKYFSLATYPLIKNSKWSGVIPVKDIDEKEIIHSAACNL